MASWPSRCRVLGGVSFKVIYAPNACAYAKLALALHSSTRCVCVAECVSTLIMHRIRGLECFTRGCIFIRRATKKSEKRGAREMEKSVSRRIQIAV